MEKVIKLIMNADKSIKILVNNEEKHIITAQDRSISANKIYEAIDYSFGDHYSIASENEPNIDSQVLEFFHGLLSDIVTKVNALSTD